MAPSELLSLYRVEMNDTARPYLWSDDFLIGTIDDAQKQFVRRTDGIPDSSTAAVVEIPVIANGLTGLYAADFALHPAVLKIRSARRKDTGRPVDVLNVEDMETHGMRFDGVTGQLRAIITGMDQDRVRVWPAPRENVTVVLSVFRLPLTTITDDEPLEIPAQHHLALMLWMKYRGYSVQDAETFDKKKAADFEAAFDAYCAAAKDEQRRQRHKTRTVAYGGY